MNVFNAYMLNGDCQPHSHHHPTRTHTTNDQLRLKNDMPFSYIFANNNQSYLLSSGSEVFNSHPAVVPFNSEILHYTQQLYAAAEQSGYMLTPNFVYHPVQESTLNGYIDLSPSSASSSISSSSSENTTVESYLSEKGLLGSGNLPIDSLLPIQACQPQKEFISKSEPSPFFDDPYFQTLDEKATLDSSSIDISTETAIDNAVSSEFSSPSSSPAGYDYLSADELAEKLVEEMNSAGVSSTPSAESTSPSACKHRPKKMRPIARMCHVCKKVIRRDISRHLRTHETVSRFQCLFPHKFCRHRTGQFNRPYDFKKHLLNAHFKFDDPNIKKLQTLNDKLDHIGTCSCGLKFTASSWLRDHILVKDELYQCPYLKEEFVLK